MLDRIIEKKRAEGKTLSPTHVDARKHVLGELMKLLGDHSMEKLNGMKKVSVSSDSKEGLETGLDKAKQLLGHGDEVSDEGENDEDPAEEAMESPETEAAEDAGISEESPEEIEKKIAELQAKLQMKRI